MKKDPLWLGGMEPIQGAFPLALAPAEVHTRQRKALAPSFSNTALLQQEPLIRSHVDKLIGRISELAEAGKAVNVSDWLVYVMFDIIGDLCFNAPFGCLETGSNTEWSRSVIKAIRCGAYEQATRRIAGTNNWLQQAMVKLLIPGVYRRWRLNHFLKSKEKVLERLKVTDTDHKDFIYYIQKNNESRELLSPMDIILNSALFMSAAPPYTTPFHPQTPPLNP